MRRYMWPNSCLPSATVLVNAAQQGSHGRLALEGVENHAAHYPRTLREWGRRLEARLTPSALGLSAVDAPLPLEDKSARRHSLATEKAPLSSVSAVQRDATLLHTLPSAPSHDAFDALKRKWQYLFEYAGAGFCKGYISCGSPRICSESCVVLTLAAQVICLHSPAARMALKRFP
jgi:cyclopropane-fatty-acyl-phospholipid synthase